MKAKVKAYPPDLIAKKNDETSLIIEVINDKKGYRWFEGEIELPPQLSLTPDFTLRKARVRIGIMRLNEKLIRSVKIFSSQYTQPNEYHGKFVIFSYNKDGILDERLDLTFKIICKPIIKEIIK